MHGRRVDTAKGAAFTVGVAGSLRWQMSQPSSRVCGSTSGQAENAGVET
jgi:hypothetical protein